LINGSFVAPAVKIENVNICSDYTLFLGKYYTVETLGIDPLTGFSSSTKLLRKFANTFSFMSQGSLLWNKPKLVWRDWRKRTYEHSKVTCTFYPKIKRSTLHTFCVADLTAFSKAVFVSLESVRVNDWFNSDSKNSSENTYRSEQIFHNWISVEKKYTKKNYKVDTTPREC